MLGRAFRRLEFVFFNEHSLKLVHEVDLFSHAEGDTRASAPDQGWVLALQQELCGTAVRYVVTLGLHGAYVISAQSHCFRPSIKLDAVVDSTGANPSHAEPLLGKRNLLTCVEHPSPQRRWRRFCISFHHLLKAARRSRW